MLSAPLHTLPEGLQPWGLPPAAPASHPLAVAGSPARFLDCLAALSGSDTTRDRDVACWDAPLRSAPPARWQAHDLVHGGAPVPPQRMHTWAPVRLHLYQDPVSGACQVWVGLDASASRALETQVAAAVQEVVLPDRSHLVRLVCNGREIELAHGAAPRRRNAPERRA